MRVTSPFAQNTCANKRSSTYQVSFGEAWVNILATADNHGRISSIPQLYDTVNLNSNKIFPDSGNKNVANIFAIVGDPIINPLKKGFITESNKTSGDVQFLFIENLIKFIKKVAQKGKNDANFETTYTPGNHCFDGGDKWLFNKLKTSELTTILTNADMDSSPIFNTMTKEERQKFVASKVIDIPDDKNPDIVNKLLILGVTIPGTEFYTPGLVKDLKIINACGKKDIDIKEEDLRETFETLNKVVSGFKKEHTNGAVLVQSHTGLAISSMIAQKVPGIDVILNGHDHKDKEDIVNGVHIISLAKDNELVKSLRLHFNDDGKLDPLPEDKPISKTFYTKNTKIKNNNPFLPLIYSTFKDDKKPLIRIVSSEDEFDRLDIDGVRWQHNVLANFVTSAILSSLNEKYPNVQAFGIPSSAFRQGLSNNASNLDIMTMLDGSIEALSEVYVGKIDGKCLFGVVLENVLSNFDYPDRNTLIQWAGIKIDKNKLWNALQSQSNNFKDIKDSIMINTDPFSGVLGSDPVYEPIDTGKEYEIALPLKYLIKDDIHYSKKIREQFKPTNMTMDDLLRKNLDKNDYIIYISPQIKEKRVITEPESNK